MRLAGKVALITGGASGIGRASAELFAAQGAKVAIVDLDAGNADATVAAIGQAGGTARAHGGDVGKVGEADRIVAAVVAEWGRLDVLMTAAGVSRGGTVTTTDPADWAAVMSIHVDGTWLFARAAIPAMSKNGGGSIITVSSQLATAGGRNNSAYITAKGAILSLTRTMALDYVDQGIRVNALVPGAIDTPMLRRSMKRGDEETNRKRSLARHPMGRFGKAEELAQGALFLASDESSFTTGTTLVCDGGWLAG